MIGPNCLFVYGTLMRQGQRPLLEWFPDRVYSIGDAKLPGSLYLVEWYPALILDEQGTVHGELYTLVEPALVLSILDDYEDVGDGLYRRQIIEVDTGAQTLSAWTYVFNQSTADLERIDSGRFSHE